MASFKTFKTALRKLNMETITGRIVVAPLELRRLVRRAAKEARLISVAKTEYPWIVVKGVVESGTLRLKVSEGGYPATGQTLACQDEIIAFAREQSALAHAGDMFPPNNPRTLLEKMGKTELWDFLIANALVKGERFYKEIHAALVEWLPKRGFLVQDLEQELLSHIRQERVADALPLAHVYLHNLADDPVRNAGEVFKVCDLMQSSRNASAYQATMLGVLHTISRNIRSMKNFNGIRGAKQLRKVIEIDLELYRRAKNDPSQSFRHRLRSESTAHIL
jgi:hypothetical protein